MFVKVLCNSCNDHHALCDDKCLDCVSICTFIEHAIKYVAYNECVHLNTV